MHCKYCGHALANDKAICPNCGMMMSDEQLKMRKDINGYKNPYVERLNKLNENYKYKEENNDKVNIVGIYVAILLIIIVIIVIGILFYLNHR